MKSISVLEFRQKAIAILSAVEKGQRIVLTYRGKPVARLGPIGQETVDDDDPFYRLNELAARNGKSLTNSEMDRLVYGASITRIVDQGRAFRTIGLYCPTQMIGDLHGLNAFPSANRIRTGISVLGAYPTNQEFQL